MALRTSLLACWCIFALSPQLLGQTPAAKKEPTQKKPSRSKSGKTEETDAVAAQRQLVAMSLLQTLADDARSFRDQRLRARVQARVADAFWETDVEKARALFHRAWEAAEVGDAESAKVAAEDLRQQQQSRRSAIRTRLPDLRGEVLRLAAKRDRALGEEFLTKLDEAQKESDQLARQADSSSPLNESGSSAKRLALARRLLEDGDQQRALEFASPALNEVNRDSIFFLSALREKNTEAADQGFVSLLGLTARDLNADANTILGLSSYAFTPFLYVTFGPEGGSNQSRERAPVPRPDLPAAVRANFFRVAAQVLLRPLAPPDQDRTTSGRTGKFMAIRRLLPLFEQYSPERAPELRTQMAAMSGDVPEDMRTGENRAITNGLSPDDPTDPIERMQQRLDRAHTSEERDGIYADVAIALAAKDPSRARDLVDKIEDSELRRGVRAFIDFQSAQSAIQEKNAAEAARIAKNGELTSLQRVWIYTRAAKLLMNSEKPRAVELLDAAATEARRIGGSDPDRARSLVAVATGFVPADRGRAWEIIDEAVKAANSAEGYSGEDSVVSARLQTKNMVVVTSASGEDFDLLGAFRALGRDDLFRAIQLSKTLAGESARAVATLAIARSVLEKPAADSPGSD